MDRYNCNLNERYDANSHICKKCLDKCRCKRNNTTDLDAVQKDRMIRRTFNFISK
jgi:hypothetical protein